MAQVTWMLVTVTGPEEAEMAIGAGVDIIDVSAPDVHAVRKGVHAVAGRRQVSADAGVLPADPGQAIEAVQTFAAFGADFVRMGLMPGPALQAGVQALADLALTTRLIAVLFADRGGDFTVIEHLAGAGFAGAMLDTADKTSGRLLDHVDPGQLLQFVSLCRANGLMAGFSGGLEAPDVPRLMALRPDIVGFRRALCHGHNRAAGLDADAIAAVRRLIPPHQEAEPVPAGRDAVDASPAFNRVFVRDFILELSIGAYRHERDRPQRVRFEVTAEVPRQLAADDDIGAVFSYDVILDTIRALVDNRHVNLVETLAEEIAARLLEHGVAAVTVKVEKLDVAPAVVGVEVMRRAR
jgi:(5-formylfuran-3-yl)methyl phosphate synthase